MRYFGPHSPLFEDEPGPVGVDLGAPVEHDFEAPAEKPEDKKPETNDEVAALRRQVDDLTARHRKAEEDSEYWAQRARRAAPREDDEPEPRRRAAPAAEADEKPEKLLDDLSSKGAAALRERGFVSKAELDEAVSKAVETAREDIKAARTDAGIDQILNTEFPEVAADMKLVTSGKAPASEIFKRGQAIYSEAVQLEPALKGSKGLLLSSLRQARAEIKADAKPAKDKPEDDTTRDGKGRFASEERRESRRSRIESQSVSRSTGSEDDDGGEAQLTAEQKTVIRGMGITEAAYRAQIRPGEKVGKKTKQHA